MTDHVHALQAGHKLEDYNIIRVLGTGGFGITYLAFDTKLDRAVAIKEYLPGEFAVRGDDTSIVAKTRADWDAFEYGLETFLSEARVLAKFEHRNIIKVHRYFKAHGTGYIVMEYAEGQTFSDLLKERGKMSEAEITPVLLKILDGLSAIHKGGFLHRDIKPGNIMMRDSDGSPVLIDFGAARQAIAAHSTSITSILTPKYAPIEQYSEKGNQGAWTDLYALGATMYRATLGQLPEEATERVMEDKSILAVDLKWDGVSVSFLSLLDRALMVNPNDRLKSAEEWSRKLQAGFVEAPLEAASAATQSDFSAKESASIHSGASGLGRNMTGGESARGPLSGGGEKKPRGGMIAAAIAIIGLGGLGWYFGVHAQKSGTDNPFGPTVTTASDLDPELLRGEFRDIVNRVIRRISATRASKVEYDQLKIDIADPRLRSESGYISMKTERMVQIEDEIQNDRQYIIRNLNSISEMIPQKTTLFLKYLENELEIAKTRNSAGTMRVVEALIAFIGCSGEGCVDSSDLLTYFDE